MNRKAWLGAGTALVTCLAVLAGTAQAQERMVVDARELVYDNNNNTVSAVGDVQILYQGRTIEADKVTYDRAGKRVIATGNARITESNGTVITGERFNLTDDFRDGFIDSLRVVNPDKTRFTAPRAERTDGETFVFDKGIYTACEPCKDNPEKPPLWQVRSARIIHKKSEQTIYYEHSRLEFAGVPIAYIPYMSGPDSTVKRKSGFLAPTFLNTSALGYGVGLPYFLNLAPNYDLTVTPTFLSRQGFLGQAEWRHRLVNGSYKIRAAGIFQSDPDAFAAAPMGAREKDFRGSLESSGKFFINPRWNFGWDISMSTDRWFWDNFRIRGHAVSSLAYLKESISTAYLGGQSPTAWFDLRGYYFQTLSSNDWQKQQPVVLPVLDYDKRIHKPSVLGGELAFNVNLVHLHREAAAFKQLPLQTSTLVSGMYDGCAVYQKDSCLVRGLPGTIARASVEASWRRNFIDPLGQMWTPYASVRADIFSVNPSTTGYANANVRGIVDTSDEVFGRVMPAVGLMYRYPFVAKTSWGTHIFEPVGQIVARPNETNSLRIPNEDSQSLVFDETNLFDWRGKFSGYDRAEGGTRANIGMLYTGRFGAEAYANFLIGQSYQVSGRNSYGRSDLINTGLESGLDKTKSDFVARAQISPWRNLVMTGAGRFDERTLEAQRLDGAVTYTIDRLSGSIGYSRYEPQPSLGVPRRREGLSVSASLGLTQYWRVRGSVLFDLDKYKYDRERWRDAYQNNIAGAYPKTGPFQRASTSIGINYTDECTVFDVSYTQSYADRGVAGASNAKDTRTVMFRLELRTLGEISYSQNLNATSVGDGITAR